MTPSVTVRPYGAASVSVLRALVGWNPTTADIGFEHYRHGPVQFRTRRGGWYAIECIWSDGHVWSGSGYLPPRTVLTVRPESPPPTLGLLRPSGSPGDYAAAGGQGIDACGAAGTLLEHDAVMQRCPVGLFDMATGKLRAAPTVPKNGYYRMTRGNGDGTRNKVTTLPDYSQKIDPNNPYDDRRIPLDATPIPVDGAALRADVLKYEPFDGQHYIRAYRLALLLQSDPVVRQDLRMLLRDAEVAWDAVREQAILDGPSKQGSGELGREWAWVAYLAATVEAQDSPVGRWLGNLFGITFTSRLRRIAKHVQSPTGLLQRLVYGAFWGSPDPWGAQPNGDGIPQNVAVAQDLEAYAQIVALEALGMKTEALSLAGQVLDTPLMKWIATDTGGAQGIHGPACDQAWPAIAAWLRMNRRAALTCVTRWKVPGVNGNWSGPYITVEGAQLALAQSPDQGKCRWAAELLAP